MIFLYGIIKDGSQGALTKNFEAPGIDQAQVYAASYKDLHMLISRGHDTGIQSDVSRETLMKSLIEYQKFLEFVLKKEDVIPFKFGTALNDEKEVVKLLKANHHTFQSLLALYQDLREFSVTAAWSKPKAVFGALLKKDRELSDLKRKAEATRDSADKIKVGQRLQTVLLSENKEIESRISQAIKKISQDSASHEKIDDFMIYHQSHLVQKNDILKFYECLEALNKALHPLEGQVQFRVIGPLPVYSFATVFARRVAKTDLENAQRVLGIQNGSGFAELRKAYAALVSVFHPDAAPDQGAEKIEEIRSAYKLLSECYKDAKRFSRGEDYISVEVRKAQ